MNQVRVALLLALLGLGLLRSGVQAHGQPVISVQPAVVAAGSSITVSGSDMEPGEVFAVSLEGLGGSFPLGQATASGQGTEGGFEAVFSLPASTPPGSYSLRAATETGEAATADLTVTAPSDQAQAGPATAPEASSAPHILDRSKPIGEVVGAIVLVVLGAGLGFGLVLDRRE